MKLNNNSSKIFLSQININNIFIFLFLALFPFGQVVRIWIFHPLDIIVGFASIYSIITKQYKPIIFKYLDNFIYIGLFAWLLNYFVFNNYQTFYGLMYLFRLFSYLYFVVYIYNYLQIKNVKELLIDALAAVSLISALFGWVQFFIFPDLKPLFIWGWDMHLFRLAGTFLDPAYLGLIIVFGLIVFMYRYMNTKMNIYFLPIIFLLVSLAFTYSRASYLAFVAGGVYLSFAKRNYKLSLAVFTVLTSLIVILPTARNHSIQFLRSFSIVARIENYKSTLNIISKSPVFGIGYNNMCIAYNKYIGFQKLSSHACSGSDSSILFILATTGVLGLIIFIYLILRIKDSTKNSKYFNILSGSFAALLVHSMFSNSMFYSWIAGWIVMLIAVSFVNE